MKALVSLTAVLAAAVTSAPARACTVCDSPNGHALRAGLFNGHFLHTLLLVAAPVPVLIALVAFLYLGMPDLDPVPPLPHDLGTPAAEPAA